MIHAANHLKKHRWRSEVFEELVLRTVEHLEKDMEKDDVENPLFQLERWVLGGGRNAKRALYRSDFVGVGVPHLTVAQTNSYSNLSRAPA
jgi:hypothetical protein